MTDEMYYQVMQILYERWVVAKDTLDMVQKETDNGTPDWELFHAAQLSSAENMERSAFNLFEIFQSTHRQAIQNHTDRMFR